MGASLRCDMCTKVIGPDEDAIVGGFAIGVTYSTHEGMCHIAYLYCLAAHNPTILDFANEYRDQWLHGFDGYGP